MPPESPLSGLFKAYDIRGFSPQLIDAAFAERLGKVIAYHFSARRVLVGRDMRETSPVLEDALIRGLTSVGADVVRIGQCSTPMFNVSLGLSNPACDVGVMVTASHNPAAYNGFKIARAGCVPVGSGSGMEDIRNMFVWDGAILSAEHAGQVTDDPSARERYVDLILSLAKLPADMSPCTIAIDGGNGMSGVVIPALVERLPWLTMIPLFLEPDGRFPNHEANPLKEETLDELKKTVREKHCLMGVAFDGDADRVGFVDEEGEQIPGDILTALFAETVLQMMPGSLIQYDVRSSWSVPEAIEAAGGKAQMVKVGHAHIKRGMRETGAVFAGELSMHFYFHDLWNCESGDLAMLLLLRRLHEEKVPLSALRRRLQTYVHSGERNFAVSDPLAIMQRVREMYAPRASLVSDLDGIRIELRDPANPQEDWWFSLRASNTEPLLRLNLEARTREKMEGHLAELIRALEV